MHPVHPSSGASRSSRPRACWACNACTHSTQGDDSVQHPGIRMISAGHPAPSATARPREYLVFGSWCAERIGGVFVSPGLNPVAFTDFRSAGTVLHLSPRGDRTHPILLRFHPASTSLRRYRPRACHPTDVPGLGRKRRSRFRTPRACMIVPGILVPGAKGSGHKEGAAPRGELNTLKPATFTR